MKEHNVDILLEFG